MANVADRHRIVFVSEYFWPEPASTGRLLGDLVSELGRTATGYDVSVLTSNRLYRGNQNGLLPATETWGSVSIRRFPSLRSGKDGFFKRAISDVVFALQSILALYRTDFDTVVAVTNPPIMPLLLGCLLWRRRKRFVYLVHDLHPDIQVAMGDWSGSSLLVRTLRRLQRIALHRANEVVVLGRCMKSYVVSEYGVAESSVKVIPNWHTVTPVSEETVVPPSSQTFDVVFGGNLGRVQDFSTILDAAELLLAYPEIRFRIVGDGERKEWIREQVESRALINVELSDFLPEPEFARLLSTAALGLVSLEPGMQGLAAPSKVYNLLAMGLPIIAIVGEDSEVAHIIREARCGYWIANGDAKTMARRIIQLSQDPEKLVDMARRGVDYVRQHASLGRIAEQYRELFETIVS